MNRNKLNFEEISQSMEVLDRDSQRGIKGGLTAAELLADIAANGIGKHAGLSYAFDGGGANGIGYISTNVSIDPGSIGGGSGYTYIGGWLAEVVVTATALGKGCGNCLNPSTIGKNIGGLTYAGGNNALSFNDKPNYSYTPKSLADYPPIGHDRRYDNLEISGFMGLFTDTRAIGADWRFVGEELRLAFSPFLNSEDRLTAAALGIGLGFIALPKTLFQLSMPSGYSQIILWDTFSNEGVNNAPAKHEH